MKKNYFYVVALNFFFDDDLIQFKIRAENEFEAVRKAMVEIYSDEYKEEDISFYKHKAQEIASLLSQLDVQDQDIKELNDALYSFEVSFSVIEVGSFLD